MTGPTPLEVFETIRERAETMLRTTFMESGRAWDQQVFEGLLKPVLGIGIVAASEHYAQHPEHLALAGSPICTVCREPVQSLQVGADPVLRAERDGDPADHGVVSIAWPCGHYQS